MSITGFSPSNYLSKATPAPRGTGVLGWWVGCFFHTPTDLGAAAADYTLFGHDAEATTPRVYTGGNDSWVGYAKNVGSSTAHMVTHAGRGGQLYETNAPNATDRLMSISPSSGFVADETYLYIYGQRRNASNVWYSWRVLVRLSTSAIVSQESWLADDNAADDYQERTDANVFSEVGRLFSGQSVSGLAIENMICVNGAFSWDGVNQRPDNDTVLSLLDGTTDYDAILNGGTKIWNYQLQTTSDLSDDTAAQGDLTINGSLSSGPVLTPWLSQDPVIVNTRDCKFYMVEDLENLTGRISGTVDLDGNAEVLEGRVLSGGIPLPGFDWQVIASPNFAKSVPFEFLAVPTGGPYVVEVRDQAMPGFVAQTTVPIFVGFIIALAGQSQVFRLFNIALASQPALTAAAHVLVAQDEEAATIVPVTLDAENSIVPLANRLFSALDVPLMIINLSFVGKSIKELFDLAGAVDPTNGNGVNLYSGLFLTLMAEVENELNALVWWHGSSDVTNPDYDDDMIAARAKLNASLGRTVDWLVCPLSRQTSGNPQAVRELAFAATSNAPADFRLLCWLNDLEMDLNDSPHPANTVNGSAKAVERIATGLISSLFDLSSIAVGPGWIRARFIDETKTAFRLVSPANLQTPTDPSDLSGFELRFNAGSWVEARTVASISVLGKTVTFTKLTGDWTAGLLELRYQHGFPFDTPSPFANEAAAAVEINKLLYEEVDGDGGLPAQPIYPGSANNSIATVQDALVIPPGSGSTRPNGLSMRMGLGL